MQQAGITRARAARPGQLLSPIRFKIAGGIAASVVGHNHRIFRRGVHTGHSPLHVRGLREAPTDWLVALGDEPAAAPALPTSAPLDELALAA